jgi:hypothetical protein
MVPAAQDQSSSDVVETGVDSTRRRGVAGIGRGSSMFMGESDNCSVGRIRFRSLHARMIDNGEAQRWRKHVGALTDWAFVVVALQPRFFKYDRPKLVRGDTVLESLDDADDIADRGDQPSESDAADDGGVSESSYVGRRFCDIKSGLSGKAGLLHGR